MAREEVPMLYPKGLRVLVVDDNPPCLKIIEKLLKKCTYNVSVTTKAEIGLNMLRENNDQYDIVITDVHMPEMNGFTLLEHIRRELDIPVIMFSGNDDPKQVMRGVELGAVDYLLKPIRVEELKNIWQHVVRRNQLKKPKGNSPSVSEGDEDGVVPAVRANERVDPIPEETPTKKRKDEISRQSNVDDIGAKVVEEVESKNETTSQKKPRVVWSPELHKKFVVAVNQYGVHQAYPKRILEHMRVEGLTRENIASHLQKYRLYLKRQNKATAQPTCGRSVMPFRVHNSSMLNTYGGLSTFGMSPIGTTATPYTAMGLLGQLNRVTSYRAPAPGQTASYLATPLSQIQSVSDFQFHNKGTITSIMPTPTSPTHVRPQFVAPQSYAGNAILNGQFATIIGGQDSFNAQNDITYNETWQQNMIGSTNNSTLCNNNNNNNHDSYMVPVQGSGSSNQSFGNNSSGNFSNNVDQSFGQATSRFMQNATEVQDGDIDALLELDDSYFLEESGFIDAFIDEDNTFKDIVGELPPIGASM